MSFSSPSYYRHVVRAPMMFSLKYFYAFFFFFAFATTTFITTRYLLPITDFFHTVPSHVIAAYPEDLEITIQNGIVSTNVDEPYKIPISTTQPLINEFNRKVLGVKEPTNLLAIDTSGMLDTFDSYDTAILLSRSQVTFVDEKGKLINIPLKDIAYLEINKDIISYSLSTLTPALPFLAPLAISALFLLLFVALPFYGLIYAIFLGTIVFVIAKTYHVPLPYLKAYQITLHLLLIPTLVFSILSLMEISIQFPFRDTIIVAILAFFVVRALRQNNNSF